MLFLIFGYLHIFNFYPFNFNPFGDWFLSSFVFPCLDVKSKKYVYKCWPGYLQRGVPADAVAGSSCPSGGKDFLKENVKGYIEVCGESWASPKLQHLWTFPAVARTRSKAEGSVVYWQISNWSKSVGWALFSDSDFKIMWLSYGPQQRSCIMQDRPPPIIVLLSDVLFHSCKFYHRNSCPWSYFLLLIFFKATLRSIPSYILWRLNSK